MYTFYSNKNRKRKIQENNDPQPLYIELDIPEIKKQQEDIKKKEDESGGIIIIELL